MPTPTTKDAKQALYAVAGAADLAVSTIRQLPSEAAKLRDRLPGEAARTYGELVRRGETLVTGVRPSRPTREAGARAEGAATWARRSARSARTSVESAAASTGRAAAADAGAVKDAAGKV